MFDLEKRFEKSVETLKKFPQQEPEGMTKYLVQDGQTDILPFLHDTAISEYNGKLYLAWYNSTNAEICGCSLIRGRYSEDGGKTWSEPYGVIGEITEAEEHYVPVNFFAHNGKFYAVITQMVGKNMTVSLDLYEQQADPFERWRRVSKISEGFICNGPPVLMEDGNYIMGAWIPMKEETPAFPVVLISQGQAIDKEWQCVFLYDPLSPESIRLRCPETTVYVEGKKITAFTRNDEGPSYVFISEDYGRTWAAPYVNALDIGNSKIYAGTLSNGKKYIIYNAEHGYFVRTELVIAIKELEDEEFSKVYTLFNGEDALLNRGSIWFYPCAYEDDGYLYVSTTLQEADYTRCAVIAKVPIDSL